MKGPYSRQRASGIKDSVAGRKATTARLAAEEAHKAESAELRAQLREAQHQAEQQGRQLLVANSRIATLRQANNANQTLIANSQELDLRRALRAGDADGVALALKRLFHEATGALPNVTVQRATLPVLNTEGAPPMHQAPAPIENVTIQAGQVVLKVDQLNVTAPAAAQAPKVVNIQKLADGQWTGSVTTVAEGEPNAT